MTKHSSSKKQGRKKSKRTGSSLKTEIFNFFKKHPKKSVDAMQLIKKLKLKKSKEQVQDVFSKLENEGALFQLDGGKFRLDRFYQKNNTGKKSTSTKAKPGVKGIVDMTKAGSAFILVEGMEQDVFVPARHLNFALDKDTVEVSLTRKGSGRRPEGRITKVLKRASSQFVGLLRTYKGHGIVHASTNSGDLDIYVENDKLNDAEDGDRVIVKLIKNGRDSKTMWGKVESNLGNLSPNDLEMNSILINAGFNIAFPPDVLEETAKMQVEIPAEEIEKRLDIRDVLTITIDPHDAKDFDDAISYEELEDGQVRVGVHIADVTHYVRPGTALDEEAFSRSTSVYLVDRVCPMLPEKLSNELCSLRPKEDKLCFSAMFMFNKDLAITDTWLGRTVIHSDHRFTYEGAQEVLETGEGLFAKELLALNTIAKKLKAQRFKKGAINFETEEVKFKLDENSKPIGVYTKVRKDANMLVEDFMLLANKAVARYMSKLDSKKPVPAVYRVHDEPDIEKLSDLILFAKELGIELNISTPKQIRKSLNALAEKAQQDEGLKMLQPMVIRSMAKAVYTTENIGHYGLSFEDYTHFTSPIRRYSDVLVHRILAKNLEKVSRENLDELESKCLYISAQERKAMEAERDSIKYKQVEYMKDRVGETFAGHISGFIERGVFVELDESKAEGLISFEHFNDSYSSTGSALSMKGKRDGAVLKMGDAITVKLIDADMEKKRLEFSVVQE